MGFYPAAFKVGVWMLVNCGCWAVAVIGSEWECRSDPSRDWRGLGNDGYVGVFRELGNWWTMKEVNIGKLGFGCWINCRDVGIEDWKVMSVGDEFWG